MAEQKIVIKLTVDDKGQLKKSSAQAEKLTKSTDKAARSTDKLQKSRDKYNRTEKGVAQISSNSTKNFSKMQQSIGGDGGSGGLVRAYALLAANVFALTAAFGVLSRAAQVETLIESIEALEVVSGRSIKSVARDLQEASGGSLDFANSLRSVSLASSAGFGTDQIQQLGEVAKNASVALGRNLADGLDRIFRGVIKVEPELLDEIGLFVRVNDASQKYADQLGIAASDLTEFQKRQAFANEAIAQGQQKFEAFSDVEPDAFSRIAASLTDMAQSALAFVNKGLLPIVDFLAKNKAFLAAAFGIVAFTIGRQVIPALGTFRTSAREAAEEARANFQEFSDKTSARLNTASKERIETLEKEIQKSKDLRQKAGGVDPQFKSRASAAEKNLLALENKKLKATGRKAALEERINILTKARTRASKANKDIIDAELEGRRAEVALLDEEIRKEKELRGIKRGGVEELGGDFKAEEKRLDAEVTRTQALENVSLEFSQRGLGASFAQLGKEIKATTAGTKGLTASLFTLRGASLAASGTVTILGLAISKVLSKISPFLLGFALAAPLIQMVGKFMGFGSEEANKFSDALSKTEELLGNFEEKLIRANEALKSNRVNSTGQLDALNAQSVAISEMSKSLLDLEVAAIRFRNNAGVIPLFFDDIGDDTLEKTRKKMADFIITVHEQLSDPLLAEEMGEMIDNALGIDGRKAISEIQEKILKQQKIQAAAQNRLNELEGVSFTNRSKQDALDQNRRQLESDILSAKITEKALQESIRGTMLDQLSISDEIVESFDSASETSAKTAESGLSLKSALDGAKDSASAFRRAFITKTDVDQPLATLNQITAGLENQFLSTEKRDASLDAILKKENAVLDLLTNQQRARLEEAKIMEDLLGLDFGVFQRDVLEEILNEQAKALFEQSVVLIRQKEVISSINKERKLFSNLAKNDTEEIRRQAEAQEKINQLTKDQAKGATNRAASFVDISRERAEFLNTLSAEQFTLELTKKEEADRADILAFMVAILREEQTILESNLHTATKDLRVQEDIAKLDLQRLSIREKLNKAQDESAKIALQTRNLLAGRAGELSPGQQAKLEAESFKKNREERAERLELEKKLVKLKTDILLIELEVRLGINKVQMEELAARKEAGETLTQQEQQRLDSIREGVTALEGIRDIELKLLDTNAANEFSKFIQDAVDPSKIFQGPAMASDFFGTIRNTGEGFEGQRTASATAREEIAEKTGTITGTTEDMTKAIQAAQTAGEIGKDVADQAIKDLQALDEGARMASMTVIQGIMGPFAEEFAKLGPEGEYQAAILNFASTSIGALGVLMSTAASAAEKVAAVGQVFASMGQMYAAQGKARQAVIDKEIDAEKKRDGQSQKSLQKIKLMEQQKELIGRKAFEREKKMKLAAAAMNVAAAVIQALASAPAPFNFALAAMTAAFGLKQLQLIKASQYNGYVAPTEDTPSSSPTNIGIGARGNEVDVSRRANAGELAYLRGDAGRGSVSNFTPMNASVGRRGYAVGSEGVVVGERGPEVISPSVPVNITPNDQIGRAPTNVNFTIHAVDAAGLEQTIQSQRGNIIGMIREAANGYGEDFLEQVDIDTLDTGVTPTTGGAY
tara:strand:+ start:1599 stop:6425 length:4827 start_codon:yes stop_codon:yes gene_type:complete